MGGLNPVRPIGIPPCDAPTPPPRDCPGAHAHPYRCNHRPPQRLRHGRHAPRRASAAIEMCVGAFTAVGAGGRHRLRRARPRTRTLARLLGTHPCGQAPGEPAPARRSREPRRPRDTLAARRRRHRSDGSFRAAVPAAWHLSMLLALIHAASAELGAGCVDEADAGPALVATTPGALTARHATR